METLASHKNWWIILLVMLAIFVLQTKHVCSLSRPDLNRSAELIKHLNEETNITESLLVGYDKRFIPRLPKTPLEVKLEIVISDVLKIKNMEAELIIFIRQTWYDFRLSWNSTKEKVKVREHFLDKIWLPDVRIVNLKDAKRFVGFGGVNMNIHHDGKVYFSQLVHVKTSCPMDLRKFPMDRQTCFLNFSSFAYGRKDLNFSSSGKEVDVRRHQLPQFELVEAKEINEDPTTVMAKFTVAITFQRRAGYYIIQVYIPASFLVILSWLAFFMESSNIADRIALEITMVLSTVFLLDGINDSVAHVSYAKASDLFVIISFGFIFLALLETMLVYRLSLLESSRKKKQCGAQSAPEKQLSIIFLKTEEERSENMEDKLKKQALEPTESEEYVCRTGSELANGFQTEQTSETSCSSSRWIDKICVVLFPMLYIGFNLGYWFYYTH